MVNISSCTRAQICLGLDVATLVGRSNEMSPFLAAPQFCFFSFSYSARRSMSLRFAARRGTEPPAATLASDVSRWRSGPHSSPWTPSFSVAWTGTGMPRRAADRTVNWGRETPRGPAPVGTTFSPFVKAGSACRIRSSFGSQGFVKFEFPFRTIIYPSVHEYSVETNMSAILI